MSTAVSTTTPSTASALRGLVVCDRVTEAEDVVSLVLADPAGGLLPAWAPGAHIDVGVGPGMVRQYSLCGAPSVATEYRIAVLREPHGRGGSRRMHDEVRVGDVLPIGGPRNNFALVAAPAYAFIAGGIGITPIMPMIAEAERGGTPWTLLYGGRRRATMAFADVLGTHGERVRVRPEEEHGLLDLDAEIAALEPGTHVYCCGPEPLLAAVEDRCAAAGVPLHVERFAAREREHDAPATAFEVVCRASGITVAVGEDESILEALRTAGIEIESSCEEGICGTCETRVLEGTPDHRDELLSDAEKADGRTMMICCSRVHGDRLVLDL